MAVTGKLFGKTVVAWLSKEIHYLSDDITVTLHTSALTVDQDVMDYADDLSAEVTGTGYTTGGKSLTSKTLTYTAGTNTIAADAADLQWTTSTITARTAVVKDNSPGTAATKPLIAYQQSDADIISSGGNWDFVINAAGLFGVVVA